MKKRRLVTSALPYVNNIPHLGNLIQVLSADVFARYSRQAGYETLYICGTDEYGTATETRAIEEGVSPADLCNRYHKIHADIYKWFEIEFDHFGRTSRPIQTEIVQNLFKKIDKAGFISEKTIEQLYCENEQRFLADRYVRGECPHCGYEEARGDQCEDCGKLLDPTELVAPRCGTCNCSPKIRKTKHLYINLPLIKPELEKWIKKTSKTGVWAKNALRMTESWIRDGLKERAITRDLKWGIPVPKEGFTEKVFYVWFDAPIGYISITADLTKDWEHWWRTPESTELFQFIGKDNIPFHTVIFPASQIASGETWTMLHHMSSSEYLNYENGKFSKSKGIGVFGNDCQETGIPGDVWRFYLYFNRPETSDYQFTWADFQERVNGELIGNLSNLINRTLSFISRFYDGVIPKAPIDEEFWNTVKEKETSITKRLDHAELRTAFREIFALSDAGNKKFQMEEPWKTRTEAPDEAAKLIRTLALLVRDLAILLKPFMPATARTLQTWFMMEDDAWNVLGTTELTEKIQRPELLFHKLEDKEINTLRERFSGTQTNRQNKPALTAEKSFVDIDLRAAHITGVEKHPNADKLYVISLDDGSGTPRTICSGLVEHYSKEELEGKTIILAYNLKSVKLRGIESRGMLLAAENEKKELEILSCVALPGERVLLHNASKKAPLEQEITIDRFFETPIRVEKNQVMVGETKLMVGETQLCTKLVTDGKVG